MRVSQEYNFNLLATAILTLSIAASDSIYDLYPAKSISGDVKDVSADANNVIVWNVLKDLDFLIVNNLRFKIEEEKSARTFIDQRDGKEYKWIRVGKQYWMQENLKYYTQKSKVYDEDKYGRVYSFNEINKVCPEGWHVPTMIEWHSLIRKVCEKEYIPHKDFILEENCSLLGTVLNFENADYNKKKQRKKDPDYIWDEDGNSFWAYTDSRSLMKESVSYSKYSRQFRLTFGNNDYFSIRCLKDE